MFSSDRLAPRDVSFALGCRSKCRPKKEGFLARQRFSSSPALGHYLPSSRDRFGRSIATGSAA